jgi:branched-chain amino acid transport system permease protein
MSQALVTGLNGLSYAFILFLLAAGFSLTFGVMGVLNLSHGALYVFGAYVGLQVSTTVLSALWCSSWE